MKARYIVALVGLVGLLISLPLFAVYSLGQAPTTAAGWLMASMFFSIGGGAAIAPDLFKAKDGKR